MWGRTSVVEVLSVLAGRVPASTKLASTDYSAIPREQRDVWPPARRRPSHSAKVKSCPQPGASANSAIPAWFAVVRQPIRRHLVHLTVSLLPA